MLGWGGYITHRMYRLFDAKDAEEKASEMLNWRDGELRSSIEPQPPLLVLYIEAGLVRLVLRSRYLAPPVSTAWWLRLVLLRAARTSTNRELLLLYRELLLSLPFPSESTSFSPPLSESPPLSCWIALMEVVAALVLKSSRTMLRWDDQA